MLPLHICHINLAKGFRGGERQTWLLINALAGQLQQTVVLRRGSPLKPMLESLPDVSVREIGKPFFIHALPLRGLSLLHAHESKAAHIAFMAHRLYKTPYIITRRVPNPLKTNFFTRGTHVRAATVVAISREIRRLLVDYDKRLDPEVIYSSFAGLPTSENSVRRLQEAYRDRFVVGHVGALVNRHKGQIYIIHTARRMQETHPDILFLFLGRGEDEQWFRQEAADLENVEFAGFKENIGDYYRILDLFVYPSMYEGLGSAVLDAFFFQLPVIATNVGGLPEMVIDGQTGLLVSPRDEAALYDKIVELYQDREKARRLAKNGHQSLQAFDIAAAREKYLQLYRKYAAE